jgi:hypothetical protein
MFGNGNVEQPALNNEHGTKPEGQADQLQDPMASAHFPALSPSLPRAMSRSKGGGPTGAFQPAALAPGT